MKIKPKPIKYYSGEGICKIRIEDETGKMIENWTIMMSDLWKWARFMKLKYGVNFSDESSKDKDLDWALGK